MLSAAELDERIRTLPLASGVQHFKNGFSALEQISGSVRKNMVKILLGCLIGRIPSSGIKAITALLDFTYIAQYSAHDDVTLSYLEDALARFHKHRNFFITTGVREDFNIPKFHSLLHYVQSIRLFGTTDNYNTEAFERFHIDFAKLGWRASNKRNEFPQMIRWLSRREKISTLEKSFSKLHSTSDLPLATTSSNTNSTALSNIVRKPLLSIAKHPMYPNRNIAVVEDLHNAPNFSFFLKVFLNSYAKNSVRFADIQNTPLPFTKVNVYNLFRFHLENIQELEEDQATDIVKAIPRSKNLPSGHFDTVVVMIKDSAESTGLEGKSFLQLPKITSLIQN